MSPQECRGAAPENLVLGRGLRARHTRFPRAGPELRDTPEGRPVVEAEGIDEERTNHGRRAPHPTPAMDVHDVAGPELLADVPHEGVVTIGRYDA
ncbi:hypothetical protein, partial [Mycolicibacterium mucogenicum]